VVLGQSASALSMGGFVEAYAPLVSKVGANPASACSQDPKHFEIPATADYNRQAGRMQPTGKLKHGDKRFVLAFAGGSMDIDGSTLYYDSGENLEQVPQRRSREGRGAREAHRGAGRMRAARSVMCR
jgi:hypothetical protein